MSQDSIPKTFQELGLSPEVFRALERVGYEAPTPIQSKTIPHLLADRDLVGQAQTGTGKTAAFALPILSRLEAGFSGTKALVLAPTRELAIQVAEAFAQYGSLMAGFHVAPIYGGQDYRPQLKLLKRGLHVVVGTPGRVMDHIRKGRLSLTELQTLVLDEADEMLRMGFIDDVEWILEQLPDKRQIALFSATMPEQIRKISKKYLKNPQEITIKQTSTSAANIRQRYWIVQGLHKLDALTRILEFENFDGMIVFVRTKHATIELSAKLEARGFCAAPINGEIAQKQREATIAKLKNGKIDILVATDVAARGLDVDRISHVINYDIPYDTESYVHRIGRTGRAGRKGEAILFVSPRERRMFMSIERATRQKIEPMRLPSIGDINDQRILNFKSRIEDSLQNKEKELQQFRSLIYDLSLEKDIPLLEIAAALAQQLYENKGFLLDKKLYKKNDKKTEFTEFPRSPKFSGKKNSYRNKGKNTKKAKQTPQKRIRRRHKSPGKK